MNWSFPGLNEIHPSRPGHILPNVLRPTMLQKQYSILSLNKIAGFSYQCPKPQLLTCRRELKVKLLDLVRGWVILVGRKCQKVPLVWTFCWFSISFFPKNTDVNSSIGTSVESFFLKETSAQKCQFWVLSWNSDRPKKPEPDTSIVFPRFWNRIFARNTGFILFCQCPNQRLSICQMTVNATIFDFASDLRFLICHRCKKDKLVVTFLELLSFLQKQLFDLFCRGFNQKFPLVRKH